MEMDVASVGVSLVFSAIMAKHRDGNDLRPLTLAELDDCLSGLEVFNRAIRRWLAEWPFERTNR
jgi:hypothetical protein